MKPNILFCAICYFRSVVHSNVMQSALALVHAMQKLEIPYDDPQVEV